MAKKKALNKKQKRFCEEYAKDCNATKSAERAGYSKKTAYSQAHDLLKKPEIKQEISRRLDMKSVKTGVTAQSIVNDILEIKDRCMTAIPVRDKEGNETGEWQFDARSALKAIEMLCKLFNINPPEKVDISVTNNLHAILMAKFEAIQNNADGYNKKLEPGKMAD